MNFSDLFKQIAPLYPTRVSLLNAETTKGGGFLLPEINLINATIDEFSEQYDEDTQDWWAMMNWNISVGIRSHARNRFKKGDKEILMRDVSVKKIEKLLYENLCYPDELLERMVKTYIRNIEPGLEQYWGRNPITPNLELADHHWIVRDKDGKLLGRVDQKGNPIEGDTEKE